MSLAAIDDHQKGDVVHLQYLLRKREYHLAELINEVVFAEQERYKAVQEAHGLRELATGLEDVVNKLLEYHITIHREVLLPVLKDSAGNSGDARSVGASPAENCTGVGSSKDLLEDLLGKPRLPSETKSLLQTALEQKRRGERLSSGGIGLHGNSSPWRLPADAEAPVHQATHRAIALSASLLQNQERLAQLLHSIQTQAKNLLHHWDGVGGTEAQDGCPSSEPTVRQQGPAGNVAPFRLENLHQHSSRARAIEEALRSVERERDALQMQLREGDAAAAAAAVRSAPAPVVQPDESWMEERAQLQKELAYAQQRVLQEQSQNQMLKRQVSQLEKVALASPIAPSAAGSSTCTHCEQTRADMKKQLSDYHAAKAAWKADEQRLKEDIASLRLQAKESVKDASLLSASPSVGALAGTPQRDPSWPASERKIGQLEAKVAAMKADLQIMEMRLAIVQDERDAEQRRILAAHERERQRLCDERDECQRIIDKMSRELQGLSRMSSSAPPAITSTAG
ncbi:conserved hypothetical protein [Leishmania major strain Friedlin]|uniref:Uncharacterized protein n=1 Tax=Leishmania major TaxID=5664 RepID=E9AFT7_LEIMA|nr:conserved hypothetical protein [Leishmania major strain Friedlin]CAG9582818.1 hypothetical_protein_-_conserved [Leishmania major strain Friedlin]CBZ13091.1 conserved hypothetical protein [Leishmania major strain Friedlin]|eukprot:XP_003722857.1 conserved hypothetical protein [Leishmania major strain Friedlin]